MQNKPLPVKITAMTRFNSGKVFNPSAHQTIQKQLFSFNYTT
jgi:hypothetical protein